MGGMGESLIKTMIKLEPAVHAVYEIALSFLPVRSKTCNFFLKVSKISERVFRN